MPPRSFLERKRKQRAHEPLGQRRSLQERGARTPRSPLWEGGGAHHGKRANQTRRPPSDTSIPAYNVWGFATGEGRPIPSERDAGRNPFAFVSLPGKAIWNVLALLDGWETDLVLLWVVTDDVGLLADSST